MHLFVATIRIVIPVRTDISTKVNSVFPNGSLNYGRYLKVQLFMHANFPATPTVRSCNVVLGSCYDRRTGFVHLMIRLHSDLWFIFSGKQTWIRGRGQQSLSGIRRDKCGFWTSEVYKIAVDNMKEGGRLRFKPMNNWWTSAKGSFVAGNGIKHTENAKSITWKDIK